MADILNKLFQWLASVLNSVLFFLPDSPFTFEGASEFYETLSYVNYFVPISSFVTILKAWLTAITAYYVVSTILRWVKAIE